MTANRLFKVDCHVHSYRSGDARTPLDRIEEAAAAAGLDYVCITDHGTIAGALEARELFTATRVVVGQECRTWAGEIIGLFLEERIPGNLQPEAVVEKIREQGGLVYLPHPCCALHNGLRDDFIERLIDEVDIVEVHNGKATVAGNRSATELAASAAKAPGAGSDAHYAEFVGKAFVQMPHFDDAASFLKALESSTSKIERGTYSYAEASWTRRVDSSAD